MSSLIGLMNGVLGLGVAVQPTPKLLETKAAENVYDPTIAIVTALDLETYAVRSVFDGDYELRAPSLRKCPITFRMLRLNRGDGSVSDILLCECAQMGNNASAVATTAALFAFPSVEQIMMVGIAGGVPAYPFDPKSKDVADHVRLGDIVFAEEIIQYDMIKLEIVSSEGRGKPQKTSARLRAAFSSLKQDMREAKYLWEPNIDSAVRVDKTFKRPREDRLKVYQIDEKGAVSCEDVDHPPQKSRRKGKPQVHIGRVGSANILLKNNTVRDTLRKTHKIKAVEMEGSGVSDAAWSFQVGFGVVRGICDYCDLDKNDTWQPYAALAAAAFARSVIERAL